ETEIILLMVKCVPVLLAVWILAHLLCEEYLRALEFRGLIAPRNASKRTESTGVDSAGETKKPG
ncbi:MAG TPA: hypothetical protein VMX57_07560, partial [Planctomycetota bacterium]|nr:hypothetical protein [Planctomycetota bacterium]